MKTIFFILIFLVLFCHFGFGVAKTPIKILKIYDGDTIQAKIDNEKFSIRLIGLDCYETKNINRAYKQAYENNLTIDDVIDKGIKSKKYLEKLYKNNKNKEIFFDFKGIDKYKRALGILYFGEINVNKALLNNGGCLEYNYKK